MPETLSRHCGQGGIQCFHLEVFINVQMIFFFSSEPTAPGCSPAWVPNNFEPFQIFATVISQDPKGIYHHEEK